MTALLLRRSDVAALLTLDECIAAVEEAFRLRGLGRLPPSAILAVPVTGGGFHVKAALLPGPRSYFAAKVNGNFPDNPRRAGLPSIQGLIVLCDGENGRPLAVMDSIEITILRTGAATAVAAKYLARPASRIATICGCGNQGRVQLRSIARVLQLERVFAFDADERRARELADELSAELRLSVAAVTDLAQAVSRSDVCVTCTPSQSPLVRREDVRPGTFIAAVGADSPEKQELEPAILASAKVVVDVLEQCAAIGELHHALDARLMQRADVHAELAEVVAGSRPGRASDEEVVVFDSTGTALQDVAAALAVHDKAVRSGTGEAIDFAL